jgi:hypothetical protein
MRISCFRDNDNEAEERYEKKLYTKYSCHCVRYPGLVSRSMSGSLGES